VKRVCTSICIEQICLGGATPLIWGSRPGEIRGTTDDYGSARPRQEGSIKRPRQYAERTAGKTE
jgi:hypothetical protein